eukprot:TRINITY_DN39271_c0_g1_i2.p1 TRINITY_DN39271_c0_g1~~TRINITY_DN39271_c0_g1_i2.p1  ORF type:complete len:219 (+),score=20.94 TRINITY_DN39271_c0_g1_i2:120-776(+)
MLRSLVGSEMCIRDRFTTEPSVIDPAREREYRTALYWKQNPPGQPAPEYVEPGQRYTDGVTMNLGQLSSSPERSPDPPTSTQALPRRRPPPRAQHAGSLDRSREACEPGKEPRRAGGSRGCMGRDASSKHKNRPSFSFGTSPRFPRTPTILAGLPGPASYTLKRDPPSTKREAAARQGSIPRPGSARLNVIRGGLINPAHQSRNLQHNANPAPGDYDV